MSCRECSEGEFWAERKQVLMVAHKALKDIQWGDEVEVTPLDVEIWARFIAGDAG